MNAFSSPAFNEPSLFLPAFPWPASDGHKYDRGHVALLSGPRGQTGAIRLAARAALRIGAGLATVVSTADALAEHAAHLDAVMLHAVAGDGEIVTWLENDPRIAAVALGPGFGRERARALLPELIALGRAMTIDADALRALPTDVVFGADQPVILTPHAGEFASAFPGISLDDHAAAAGEAAQRVNAVVLLKGSRTVVAAPDGRRARNAPATPFLATAGSGDVLTGIASGLLAQGMPAFEAACCAVWIHAEAGASVGPGLISEDLPDALPRILRRLFEAP